MISTADQAHQFINLVADVTGKRPKMAGDIAATLNAVAAVAEEDSRPTIEDKAFSGELNARNAAALLAERAAPVSTMTEARAEAVNGLLRRWRAGIAAVGPIAREVSDLLAPVWVEHWTAFQHAAETGIGPSTTADDVVDSGNPAMVTAWQSLDEHRRPLDQIRQITDQLVEWRAVTALDPRFYDQRPLTFARAAWYCDGPGVDVFGRLMSDPLRWNTRRGGLWLPATTVPGLGLRHVTDVDAFLREDNAARTQAEADHYAATHT